MVMPQRQRWYGLRDCGTMQCLALSSFAFSASIESHHRKADHMRMVSPMSEVCSKLVFKTSSAHRQKLPESGHTAISPDRTQFVTAWRPSYML